VRVSLHLFLDKTRHKATAYCKWRFKSTRKP